MVNLVLAVLLCATCVHCAVIRVVNQPQQSSDPYHGTGHANVHLTHLPYMGPHSHSPGDRPHVHAPPMPAVSYRAPAPQPQRSNAMSPLLYLFLGRYMATSSISNFLTNNPITLAQLSGAFAGGGGGAGGIGAGISGAGAANVINFGGLPNLFNAISN